MCLWIPHHLRRFQSRKKNHSRFFYYYFEWIRGHGWIRSTTTIGNQQKKLINLVGTHNADDDYADDFDDLNEDYEIDADTQWVNDIIDKVPIAESGAHLNVFYSKNDVSMFMKLLSKMVLWSNIMNNSFGSTATLATSADVESSFKSLKILVLERKMVQAHTFVKTHIELVDAEIKLSAMITDNCPEESMKRKRSNSMIETSPSPKHGRKRSNSNQYEQSIRNESSCENGKNGKLEFYDLVSSIFST